MEQIARFLNTGSICQSDLEMHSCTNCEFETYLNVSLRNHVDITHKNLSIDHNLQNLLQGYCCQKCGLHTFSVFILARHVCKTKSKKNYTNQRLPCKYCQGYFTRKSNLARHMRNIHKQTLEKNIKWFKCKHCPYQVRSDYNLINHIFKKHTLHKVPIKCEYCSFKTLNLKSHILNKHTSDENIKWFQCPYCSLKAKQKGTLKKHILRQHTLEEDIKWFQCEQCPYKAKRKEHLQSHIMNKHTSVENIKWYKCDNCQFKTKLKSNLTQHIKHQHTSEKNAYWFKCDKCSFKTKVKSCLKSHIGNIHTAEENIKWLQCEYCPHKTKQKSALKTHVSRKHSGNKQVQS